MINLLDPSFRRLNREERDHGGCAVVVVEGLDVPGPALDDWSPRTMKAVHEELTSEKNIRKKVISQL